MVSLFFCRGQLGMAGNPQGELLEEQVWEDGESERQAVTAWIGIQNLSYRESGQTSIWCNSRHTTT